MAEAYGELAQSIAATPGLLWKVWTENAETGEAGGIYLFADAASAEAYRALHIERLRGFGVTQIRARAFAVNAPLSRVTRGPIGQ